ncbi:hypothetical protein TNCV_3516591 [Trichonephila clavipes]|nr:hypothetical protein TNCV_3516591 [Trichonephila clavipes]
MKDRFCKKIFLAKPVGNRPGADPRLRWTDCVEKELNILEVKNWKTFAKRRGAGRKFLEKVKAHPRSWVFKVKKMLSHFPN